jgi:hypothetical protein
MEWIVKWSGNEVKRMCLSGSAAFSSIATSSHPPPTPLLFVLCFITAFYHLAVPALGASTLWWPLATSRTPPRHPLPGVARGSRAPHQPSSLGGPSSRPVLSIKGSKLRAGSLCWGVPTPPQPSPPKAQAPRLAMARGRRSRVGKSKRAARFIPLGLCGFFGSSILRSGGILSSRTEGFVPSFQTLFYNIVPPELVPTLFLWNSTFQTGLRFLSLFKHI